MLRGKVWEVQADRLILDVQGVGYQLSAPYGLLDQVHAGQELILYTHVILREDEPTIYGFAAAAEKELFLLMLSVSGIGPKAALAILSALGSGQTESAIATENIALLTKVPGIGKKTAQRLILELKEKFKVRAQAAGGGGPESPAGRVQTAGHSETVATLLALGFSQEEAGQALQALPDSARESSTEEQVRLALRSLAASN